MANDEKEGKILIKSGTIITGNVVIINYVEVGSACKLNDSVFLCDNVVLDPNVQASGFVIVADQCKVGVSTQLSGNAICNMQSVIGPNCMISDYAIITGRAELGPGIKVSGNGFIGGNAKKPVGNVSGEGRVFGDISCIHDVSGDQRHYDNRSCTAEQEGKGYHGRLDDERRSNTPGTPTEEQPPPTIL